MLVFLGSSSVERGSPLPREIAARLKVGESWRAEGVRGSRVRAWVERVERVELAGADVVVLLGGNDATVPDPADIAQIDARARARGARAVVWILPPQYLGQVMRLRTGRMALSLRLSGVRFIPRAPRIPAGEWAADGVHPTAAGYRRWAAEIAPFIASALSAAAGSAGNSGVLGAMTLFVGVLLWTFS
jgi:lysophospholipase L1-like esterase